MPVCIACTVQHPHPGLLLSDLECLCGMYCGLYLSRCEGPCDEVNTVPTHIQWLRGLTCWAWGSGMDTCPMLPGFDSSAYGGVPVGPHPRICSC